MQITRRQFLLTFAATASAPLLAGKLRAAEDDQAWNDIRKFLFDDQPVLETPGIVHLDAPIRPPNGGDVTVKIISEYPQNDNNYIQKYYLVVDKNPAPVAAEFNLSSQTPANIGTRIRVNEYSNVRVIAQTNDGTLYMDRKYVKASGGCSAPPMGDASMAKLNMGKTKLLQEPTTDGTRRLHLAIMHPSNSGLQKDPITTYFIPPHYVETVEVTNKSGKQVFFVKGDISFSENPSFDFEYGTPQTNDILTVKVVDSRKQIYQTDWPLTQA